MIHPQLEEPVLMHINGKARQITQLGVIYQELLRATYSPGALTTNTYFRREVTSGACGTVYTSSVLITVYDDLVAGAIGSAQTICYNTSPAGLTDDTSPTGGTGSYAYQWQSSPDNATWSNISGATSATYSPGALTTNTYFRREK